MAEQRESEQKQELVQKSDELTKLRNDSSEKREILKEDLEKARNEPNRLGRQAEAIEKAANAFESDLDAVKRKIKRSDGELEKQSKKISESERLKVNLMEKLEFHRQTLVQRENDCAVIRKQLERERATHHDLVTQKVELGLKSKESDQDLRHCNEQINFTRKDYDSLKRQYKKKRGIADQVKAVIPQLEDQMVSQEHVMRSYKEEGESVKKRLNVQKDEVDLAVATLLQQENVEKSQADVSTNLFHRELDLLIKDLL